MLGLVVRTVFCKILHVELELGHQENGELRIRLDKVIKDIKYLKDTSD